MNDRTLRVLEFNKIKDMLIAKAESSLGRALAEKNRPSMDYGEILQLQKETSDAAALLIQRGNITLGEIGRAHV